MEKISQRRLEYNNKDDTNVAHKSATAYSYAVC